MGGLGGAPFIMVRLQVVSELEKCYDMRGKED